MLLFSQAAERGAVLPYLTNFTITAGQGQGRALTRYAKHVISSGVLSFHLKPSPCVMLQGRRVLFPYSLIASVTFSRVDVDIKFKTEKKMDAEKTE